jgi:hypothetical protein
VAALAESRLHEPVVGYEAGVAWMEPAVEVANPLPEAPQLSIEVRDVAQHRRWTRPMPPGWMTCCAAPACADLCYDRLTLAAAR